ncbi:MAG: hypothetical protein ACPIOQ_41220, partial [Promethearchaeia archaeon]
REREKGGRERECLLLALVSVYPLGLTFSEIGLCWCLFSITFYPTFTTQQFGAGSDRAYSGIYARCFLASLGNRARD